jgi:GNAT superfamily N-acetyltransferase
MTSALNTAAARVEVRPSRPDDTPLIVSLIRELAIYEKLEAHAIATESDMREALFGAAPRVFCDIAEHGGEPAGLAVWFYNFSTFRGRHGIYLEDLFVRPEHRGAGLGKALLRCLARRCVDEGLARLDWAVLDWNTPSIGFYRAQGAVLLDDWTTCRLEGDALARFGSGG